MIWLGIISIPIVVYGLLNAFNWYARNFFGMPQRGIRV